MADNPDQPVENWSPVAESWSPVQTNNGEIPQAFYDRVSRGLALSNAMTSLGKGVEGFKQGFGSDPLGWSPEHVQRFRDLGIYRDPASGRAGPLRLFNEAVMQPAGVVGDLAMRTLSGLTEGAAGAFGQLIEDAHGYLGNADKAHDEAVNLINYALMRGDQQFSRIEDTGAGPRDQAVGTLPHSEDFKTAANVISGGPPQEPTVPVKAAVAEANLRQMWKVDGIHPAEAAADAANDDFLKSQIVNEPYNKPDPGHIAPVVNGSAPTTTPRSTLAMTGDPRIDRILESDVTRDVVDAPVIDREHDVPYTAGGSVPLDDPTTFIDRHFPRSFTIDGVTFDPADPFVIHENVEQHTMEMLLKGGMDAGTAYKVAHFEFAEKAEGAWYRAHGIDQSEAEVAYAPYMAQIQRGIPTLTAEVKIDGKYYTGNTHAEAYLAALKKLGKEAKEVNIESTDGFVTSKGQHITREQAYELTPNVITRAGGGANFPPNLYERPYPHDEPSAAKGEAIAEPKPTKQEIARAHEILDKQLGDLTQNPLRAVGAEVTAGMPPLDRQPLHRPGSLVAALHTAGQRLLDMGRDLQMKVAPMAVGSRDAMATAKDFSNSLRRNRWEWSRVDDDIKTRFNPEQRKRMWQAADEESVARQLGESREHQGLVTLEPEERRAVEDLQSRAQLAWARARDLGMVEGEGLPAYTPRMVINAAGAIEKDGTISLNRLPDRIGRNLFTTTGNLKGRKYMTAEETEAAMKAKYGDQAELARDIRALPMATAKLEDAIAGRTLINQIRDIGKRTGDETVAEGFKPVDSQYKWFTIDHPAFKTWRTVDRNELGEPIFKQVPIYVRGDFEGPLRAVLSEKNGALYSVAMSLKGKTMGLIMNSPAIHNAVEFGRAFPAMPGKMITLRVYRDGGRARQDVGTMTEAINNGLVPIGHRYFNQDISSVMEEPSLAPGRSLTAKMVGAIPGLFDPAKGDAVKAAIDKAGDFWHNTLLWDQVGKLQMGLYVNFRDDLRLKGVDPQTSARMAAHFANRYAGALPIEAMSNNARKISNMLMFSRSFTLGNLGVFKDAMTGLPRDVLAQIERDTGGVNPDALAVAKGLARRKAAAVVGMDVALFYVANSVLQSAINMMRGDSNLDQEEHGYVMRFASRLKSLSEHPLEAVTPLSIAGGAIGGAIGGPVGVAVGTALGTGVSQLKYLSSTYANEPGRQDRVKVGYAADGTGIYMRNPFGKIGEEFVNYTTTPLDMMLKKQSTSARPAWQILNNDAGFGRKIYDPDPDTTPKMLHNMLLIAEHFMGSQVPEGQIEAGRDLVKGDGDKEVNALHAFGPVAGLTFSKGAPVGPAVGEVYHAKNQYQYRVDAALPDLRKQILRGDVPGATERMTELGVPPGLKKWYIKTTMNPATRLSGRALRDFFTYATPEQRARFEAQQ